MTRKAGQVVRRGARKFVVRVYLGTDTATGKRHYLNRTVHGTKKDAQKLLNSLLRERDLGTLREPERLSVNEHLDRWLEAAAAPRLRENTYQSYRWLLKRYVRPKVGATMLHRLSPAQVQAMTADLQARGLAPRTVRYAHSVLRSALEQAVKWGLIPSNPADAVDLPKRKKREMRAMTSEQAQRFLAAAAGDDLSTLFAFLLGTGLRPSEAVAVQWRDVDLATGELQVRRTVLRPRGGGWRFADTKTGASRRRITVPAGALAALREHHAKGYASPHGLVFCSADGEPLHVNNISGWNFKRVLERAGLSGFRLYDLRHTCASLLLLAGVHPKVVAERLGHSSIRETMDTYSHVIPSMQEAATSALDALLYPDEQDGEAAARALN